MNITGVCPLIVTKDYESVREVFEDIGFEKCTSNVNINDGDNECFMMKDAGENCVHIVSSETILQDFSGVSIIVDDHQEAYDLLITHGFIGSYGNIAADAVFSKSSMLFAPSGFVILVSQDTD